MPADETYDKPHPLTVRGADHHPGCWNKPRPERWPEVQLPHVAINPCFDGYIEISVTRYPDPMTTVCHVGSNDNLKECEGCRHKVKAIS